MEGVLQLGDPRKMASIYSNDPAEYWVRVTYDDGSEELIEHLTLNKAYDIENRFRNEQRRHYREGLFQRFEKHIKNIKSGRIMSGI